MQTSSYVLFYFPLTVSTLAERLEMLHTQCVRVCVLYLQCKWVPCLTISVPVSTFWFDVFALFSLLLLSRRLILLFQQNQYSSCLYCNHLLFTHCCSLEQHPVITFMFTLSQPCTDMLSFPLLAYLDFFSCLMTQPCKVMKKRKNSLCMEKNVFFFIKMKHTAKCTVYTMYILYSLPFVTWLNTSVVCNG